MMPECRRESSISMGQLYPPLRYSMAYLYLLSCIKKHNVFAAGDNMENIWFNTDKFHEQRTQQHLSEEKEIVEALRANSTIDMGLIKVHSGQGVITLEGEVADKQTMSTVMEIVKNIPGVGKIVNDLKLSGRESHQDQ